ncbi:hypothetical protein ELB75_06875 [Eikenella corrodens]|uniref:Uncharacterized protein n=1 Tax=Eikenella corrodens TaxID=539 RepID=A0A3S9SK01_EIKCO|nr:hypothetical protein ELB75_06875 [Eikenella corrodens]
MRGTHAANPFLSFGIVWAMHALYSELNLNQYSVVSPCRTMCTVCGSPPCPDLNLIHYNGRLPENSAALFFR